MSDPKNGFGNGEDEAMDPALEPANDRASRREGPSASEYEGEIAQLKEELLRALAETENVRKRGERDRYDISQYAIKEFAYALLSVADNLRRALEAVPVETAGDNVKNLMIGIEATERELLNTFEKFKVKRIEAKGEKFNPNFHQAIAEVPANKPAGTVMDVVQPGYTIADRLLRPAMVTVARPESTNSDSGSSSVDTTV